MPPSRVERALERMFNDQQDGGFGTGWMSGTAGVFLGFLAVLGAIGFWAPDLFTTAEFRPLYRVAALKALLQVVIGVTFLLAATSLLLRERKVLGLTGLAFALAATLIGTPPEVAATTPGGFTIGLDWFVLNLLLLTLVFIPLERAFPLRASQKTFRFGWATDGVHFLVSHLAVQTISFLTLLPATSLASLWQPEWLHQWVRSQPIWVQFIEVVFFADLFQYWAHRAFHTVPLLWRMHAVHHSSRAMDWLAGSRLHVIDVVVTRGLVLVPVFLLGFAQPAFYAYVVFVAFHAVFIHANVRFRFGWLDYVIATPRGHHWHHAVKPVDTNFAVHVPLLDRLFGTQYLPGNEWPPEYGISGPPVPEGWWAQQSSPFRRP